MPLSTNAKNSMLNHLGGEALFASLHDGAPGDNGANEISGGSPAYARKGMVWDPATDGAINSSNQPVFDIPPGTTIAHVGFWTALSGGVWKGSAPLVNESWINQGTYKLEDMDLDLNLSA